VQRIVDGEVLDLMEAKDEDTVRGVRMEVEGTNIEYDSQLMKHQGPHITIQTLGATR